jgi:hypothetical protein
MAAGLHIDSIVIRNTEGIGGQRAYAMNPGNVGTLANWPHSSAELARLPVDH